MWLLLGEPQTSKKLKRLLSLPHTRAFIPQRQKISMSKFFAKLWLFPLFNSKNIRQIMFIGENTVIELCFLSLVIGCS
jgi:hypothetical protein